MLIAFFVGQRILLERGFRSPSKKQEKLNLNEKKKKKKDKIQNLKKNYKILGNEKNRRIGKNGWGLLGQIFLV